MNLAILSTSYAPEPTGIGPYSAELAESLAERGHGVRVVACFPYYPDWVQRVPKGTFLYRTERRNAVSVTRCRTYVPTNPRPSKRLLHELSWISSAFPIVLGLVRWADAWVVVTPDFGSALLGACIARCLKRPTHVHVQDLVPDVAIESGQITSRTLRSLARKLGEWTYRSFASASVISEAMGVRLQHYVGPDRPRVLVAPNWARTMVGETRFLPAELWGRKYIVYAGSLGQKQDLSMLLRVADLLEAREGPLVVVLGDGPGRETLRGRGSNLRWLGLVEDRTYAAVVSSALAGVVALVPSVSDSVMPSKLVGYLAAGTPVVMAAAPETEAARLVRQINCGIVVSPGDSEQLADAVYRLFLDPTLSPTLGQRGKAYADTHWNRGAAVDALEGALLRLERATSQPSCRLV